jgi:DNA-binding MarR family transcriptional regulator
MRKPQPAADDPPPTTPAAAASRGVPPNHRVPAHLARQFQQICLGIAAEATGPAGLTPIEYALIGALDDSPDMDQGTLAAMLGINTVSTHHMSHRLQALGLVEQRLDPGDRRSRLLRLTPRGHALRQELRSAGRAAQERILAPLAPAERPLFVDMLTRLVEAHEAYARPGNGRRRASRPAAPEPFASGRNAAD